MGSVCVANFVIIVSYCVFGILLCQLSLITITYPFIPKLTKCTYSKTLSVGVPFSSRIAQAKQNRGIKGREYQPQASILNCMVLIRQNKGGQNNFAC